MELIFAGAELARYLEDADAGNARASAGEYLDIGGGVAAFAGPTSPLTHAIGLGMRGPVPESDLDKVEEFYRMRHSPCELDLCPLADPSLFDMLGRRSYRISEFNNVLVRRLQAVPETQPGRVEIVTDADLWARTLTAGFLEKEEVESHELAPGLHLAAMPGTVLFLAAIEGAAAAGGAARIQGTLATLFADSTLARYRNRGLQKELIAARLQWAASQGTQWATASTLPGSVSQWNYVRAGFQIAYTKASFRR